MAALIRHTVSEPKKPFWQNLLYVLTMVLGINILVELTNYLPRKPAAIVSVGILVFAAALCSFLINRKLAQYTYILIEDELIFYKQIGKREIKILNIKVDEINWIKQIDLVSKEKKAKKIYGLACKLRGKGVYVGEFQQNNSLCRFIFQPSEDLYHELKRLVS